MKRFSDSPTIDGPIAQRLSRTPLRLAYGQQYRVNERLVVQFLRSAPHPNARRNALTDGLPIDDLSLDDLVELTEDLRLAHSVFDHAEAYGRDRRPTVILGGNYRIDADDLTILCSLHSLGFVTALGSLSPYGHGTLLIGAIHPDGERERLRRGLLRVLPILDDGQIDELRELARGGHTILHFDRMSWPSWLRECDGTL